MGAISLNKKRWLISLFCIGAGFTPATNSARYKEPPFSIETVTDSDQLNLILAACNHVSCYSTETDTEIASIFTDSDKIINTADEIKEILKLILKNELVEEDLINFVSERKNDFTFTNSIEYFFSNASNAKIQLCFLELLLSSNVDIFVPWYKKALEIGLKSDNSDLSFFSNDVLTSYKDNFDLV